MKIFDVIELNNKNKAIVIAINGNEIKVKNIDAIILNPAKILPIKHKSKRCL